MKTSHLLLLLFLAATAMGQSTSDNTYKLVEDEDGIFVEIFDSTNVDENRYNHNNSVYKVGNRFTYRFEHITPTNEVKYFNVAKDFKNWEFVDAANVDSNTVESIVIVVANGNPMAAYIPDYSQTALVYKNGTGKGYSMSGAVENEANLWMHPPRHNYFKILELNPFPYLKTPYEVGNKWTWNLKVGAHWADSRWKLWEGQIENNCTYEITDKRTVKTELGEVECLVIESTAISRIGETSLIAYFNSKYGFVKLNYTNIDGSKTNFELIDFTDKKAKK